MSNLPIEKNPNSVTASRKPIAKNHLDYIDGLRGFACLWVLALHASQIWTGGFLSGTNLISRLWMGFVGIGFFGVNIFLVLSGFCLCYPLARKNNFAIELKQFYARRIQRIVPPYYVVFCLSLVLLVVPFTRSRMIAPTVWFDLPLHLLMLHNVYPDSVFTILPPAWTLALEFQLYLIFPLLVLLLRRRGVGALLSVTLLISLGWQSFWFLHFGRQALLTMTIGTYAAIFNALPGRVFEFAAGMAAAVLVAQRGKYKVGSSHAAILFSASLAVACVTSGIAQFPFNNLLWGVVTASAIVVLGYRATRDVVEGGATRTLPSILQPLVKIGLFSYSLYLVHYEYLSVMRGVFSGLGIDQGTKYKIIYIFLVFPLCIALGYIMFQLVERRFIVKSSEKSPVATWLLTTAAVATILFLMVQFHATGRDISVLVVGDSTVAYAYDALNPALGQSFIPSLSAALKKLPGVYPHIQNTAISGQSEEEMLNGGYNAPGDPGSGRRANGATLATLLATNPNVVVLKSLLNDIATEHGDTTDQSVSSDNRSAATIGQQRQSVSSDNRSAATIGQQRQSVSSDNRSAATIGQQRQSVNWHAFIEAVLNHQNPDGSHPYLVIATDNVSGQNLSAPYARPIADQLATHATIRAIMDEYRANPHVITADVFAAYWDYAGHQADAPALLSVLLPDHVHPSRIGYDKFDIPIMDAAITEAVRRATAKQN